MTNALARLTNLNAAQWRARAKVTREIALAMVDPATISKMEALALGYEENADAIENLNRPGIAGGPNS